MEIFKRIQLFASAQKLDRRAGHGPHGKCRTTARIAINARHDNAGDAHLFLESLGGIHRILPGHGIHNQQGFMRLGGGLNLGHFGHQRFINRKAPGSVQHHYIVKLTPRDIHGAGSNFKRALAGDDRQAGHFRAFGQLLQLQLRRRAMHIKRCQQYLFLVAPAQAQRDLARGCGLARTLQAHHQNGDRRRRIQINATRPFSAAKRFHQSIIDDFDDLLRGGNGADYLLPHGAFLHARNKVADHRQGDISFQQRHAHFAQRFGHIGFAQRATAAQPIKNTVELAGQSLKHGSAQ